MTLQALYGTIPQIFGKGECARVRQMLLLKNCMLFFGTALRSVWLNAPVGLLNPATDPSCHIGISGLWPSGLCHLWPKELSLLLHKSSCQEDLPDFRCFLLIGTLPFWFNSSHFC